MTINMPALHDVLVAILTTVGIAVAVTIALVAAGAVYQRGQTRTTRARRPGAGPSQHPTQTDEAHELVLR